MKPITSYINKYMADFLNMLRDNIFITDTDCIIRFANTAYLEFLGIKREDMVGKHIDDVRPGSYLPELFKNRKPMYNIPRKVGLTKTYCDYFPLIYCDQLIGGLVIVKDAERINQLMQMLEESKEKISQLNSAVSDLFKVTTTFDDIIGCEQSFKDLLDLGKKAAESDSYVLLLGESGTGKDMLAKAIHNTSLRRNFPFVDINCAALPENLLESELFGYVGGAFTGANKKGKIGLFEIAEGGTVFLDEIAEIPLNLQAKLLRVLQEKKIRRLGGEKSIPVNVRVIAATNKNILNHIMENKFREDLYYRLAVFIINLPPLRNRKEDLPLLIDKFTQELQRKRGKYMNLQPEVRTALVKYDWPGNIRELKNALEYAAGVAPGPIVTINDLPYNITSKKHSALARKINTGGDGLDEILDNLEKELLKEYLISYGDDGQGKKRIAGALKVSLATLYNKLKKHHL